MSYPPVNAPIASPTRSVTREWLDFFRALNRESADGITQLTGDVTTGTGGGVQAATLANSGVTAGTYGDATNVPQITVDAKGRVTAAADVPLAGGGITELTGDVTAGPGSGSQVATIPNDTVTYAKMQNVSAASRLVGRGDSGAGDPQEIALGAGLSMAGTTLSASAGGGVRSVGITVDGAGSVLTTGLKGYVRVPFGGTITAATLLADQVGSVVIDVWKDTYANFPPTDADSITAAAPPTLSAAQSSEDTTLTGWTTAIAAGDVLGFNIDSVATITRVTLQLTVQE